MIDLNILIALVSFYFVMYVTPGPNNAMVLASGLSLGFSLKGDIDIDSEKVNLKGVLVPAYAINALIKNIPLVGPIITGRKGEGIIGVDYSMVGDGADPEITINPLSIFTPGILRSFFDNFSVENNE